MKEPVTKEHLEERIIDWKHRVSQLYENINTWLNNTDYSTRLGSPVPMYEWLMSEFKIDPTELDSLDIIVRNRPVMSFKPKGLWIIGGNGRIDILTLKKSFTLIDFAESFQPPIWKLFDDKKNNGLDFNRDCLMNILL